MSGGSGGSELGLFGVDFATTKNGNKRSLASQIRFRKTLQATIPPTLLLDGRLAKDLQPVKEPKQKLEEIRSGPVTAVEPENEVPKLTDARLLAEIQKFKFPRNPAMENQLLILEPVLCDFVKKFSRAQLKELFQRLYARACLVVAALQRKYQLKEEALSAKGVFHPAANHSRCQSMMQVELRRIRLDMLEVDVLEEMAYEEAERRWREAHPDGEEPPMDSDNIVLGTIRNPNAGAKSAAQVAAEKRRILEKEASQQRWSMQSTVDPAVRTRALGGAMNAKFVKQRSAKTSKLIGAPLTASQIRPWRPSKKMSRAKAAAAAANAATIAQSGELEEADSSNDKSPLGTTESAAGVDDSHNVDAKLRSSQSSHSPARPGALALRSGSSSGENDHAQQLLSIWKQLEVPVALQYQFLCKYSEPRYAGELQNVIADLNKVCELIGRWLRLSSDAQIVKLVPVFGNAAM
eukprot:INCI16145.3.p1 GENE.INCI16145.3~~INCI16145.3.p1  ORF type:complete len:464 (-),score=93.54 INCI16145.3:35-1426(-)